MCVRAGRHLTGGYQTNYRANHPAKTMSHASVSTSCFSTFCDSHRLEKNELQKQTFEV